MIKCPCCENESTIEKWKEKAGDHFIPCPMCENVCTRDEFEEGMFNRKE